MVNLLVFSIAWSNNLISSIVQITLLNGKRLRESSVSCPRTQQNNPDSTDKPILINCIVQHDNLIKSLLKVIPWKFCATDFCALTVLHFYLKVLKAVDELNKDSTIHGIIVQLPQILKSQLILRFVQMLLHQRRMLMGMVSSTLYLYMLVLDSVRQN